MNAKLVWVVIGVLILAGPLFISASTWSGGVYNMTGSLDVLGANGSGGVYTVQLVGGALPSGNLSGGVYTGFVGLDFCGNNVKGPEETCDGSDLDGKTCVTQGFSSGTLSCASDCKSFVTSSCTSASSGGSGGGGGGGGAGGSPANKASFFISVISVANGVTKTIAKEALAVTEIRVDVNVESKSVSLDVGALADRPAGVGAPPDPDVYQYLEINRTNLPDGNIRHITVGFSVNRSWISAHGIDPNSIFLLRYNAGSWERYAGRRANESAGTISYQAVVPGLSVFTITGQKPLVVPAPVAEPVTTPTPTASPQPSPEATAAIEWREPPRVGSYAGDLTGTMILIGGVVAIALIGGVFFLRRKRPAEG